MKEISGFEWHLLLVIFYRTTLLKYNFVNFIVLFYISHMIKGISQILKCTNMTIISGKNVYFLFSIIICQTINSSVYALKNSKKYIWLYYI